jgi:transcriptional regulator with XRE-family HTH domain
MNLGNFLKKIRVEKGQTLAEVAKAVNLTASSMSQIENGKISPSIITLEAILRFYQMPMSDFFKQMEQPDIIVVRKNETDTIKTQRGILITLLASKLQNNAQESYDIELQPELSITLKDLPPDLNGERFIIVRDGDIQVSMPKNSYRLQKGDSINFKSYYPCIVKNNAKKSSKFFICGMPPVL